MISSSRLPRLPESFFLLGAVVLLQMAPPAAMQGQQKSPEKYILGWVPIDSIYHAMPNVKPDEETYAPDAKALAELQAWKAPMEIQIFLGSWCKDTKRELPRFLAALHRADSPAFQARYFGLDRSKKDNAGIAQEHKIEKIPTFIFYRDGVEVGRIVEQPAELLEMDWVRMLHADPDSIRREQILRMLNQVLWSVMARASLTF
jgi:thiol-disulfide isomerase/thioredoxin